MIEIQSNQQTIGELLADKGIAHKELVPVPVPLVTVGPKMVVDPSKAKIERGISMPPAKQFKKGSSWLPLLNKMQIGDSVLFAGATLAQLGYVRLLAKKHKLPVSMRARDNGVRMWRVPEDKPLQTEPLKLSIVQNSIVQNSGTGASDDDGLGA